MTHEPRESAWAFRQLMLQAQKDLDEGRSKPARIIAKDPDRKITHIGWMKRQLLRREFRK